MSDIVKNRSEILFLYDVKDANPNGDPVDENKPRIDEETSINIVTDVRLKRTIRDYLYNFKGKEIFVREIRDDSGNIQDAKTRARDFENDPNKIKKECIDVRLFGGTIPIATGGSKDSSIRYTGPVQFKMGRSLHRVELKYIKGTGAFASGKGKEQKTFREEWILPYSLICFYGIINENAVKDTDLTEYDVSLLLEGMWNGTKNLISRSKIGHTPRLLLKINYKENNYHIGDLDKLIEFNLDSGITDENLRDISQGILELGSLIETLKQNKDKIDSIEYICDMRLRTSLKGEEKAFGDIIGSIGVNVKNLRL